MQVSWKLAVKMNVVVVLVLLNSSTLEPQEGSYSVCFHSAWGGEGSYRISRHHPSHLVGASGITDF